MDSDLLNKDFICTLCRKILNNAYQSYCGCHYCRRCIVQYLRDEDKYCPGGKRLCNEKFLVMDRNVTVDSILNQRVQSSKVHCPNKPCSFITELTQIEEHLRVCNQQSMECPYFSIGCENEGSSKENMLVHLHDDVGTHSQLLIELINNLKNEVNGLKEDFAMSKSEMLTLRMDLEEKELQMGKLRREMVDQRKSMIKQEKDMENQIKETNELKIELERLRGEPGKRKSIATVTRSMSDVGAIVNQLVETVAILNVGTNTKVAVGLSSFTVDKFSARKISEEVILSPHFYSHTNGYKLQLSVEPKGFGSGVGTHLSVFCRICKGEYDDVLPWPCRHTFTIGISKQRGVGTHASQTLSYATAPENQRYTFHKPINKDNDGYGCHKFVSHSDLRSVVGLVVDDCVIIRCIVNAPP